MLEKQKHGSHHQYMILGGTPGRPKFTTRHLAALDFLQNVPMAREQEIILLGRENVLRMQRLDDLERDHEDGDDDSVNENRGDQQLMSTLSPEEVLASQNELAGKKLLGPHAVVGKYPLHYRYYLQQLTEQRARNWEEKFLNQDTQPSSSSTGKPNAEPSLLNSRVFFSRVRSYPVLVGSFIKYNAGEEKAKFEKLKADDRKGMEVFLIPERDWRGHSFKEIINKQHNYNQSHEDHLRGMMYDPDLIDDPKLIYGTNKLDMKTSIQTGPILSSIITYVNAKDLKEELNEKFREMHPGFPPSLTLSKIRNVKKEALLFCHKLGLELSTLAIAFICFERLCLAKIVTKFNRKLTMAVCLLIAYKFNESTVGDYRKVLRQLLDFCDNEWDLPRSQIFEAELGALVHLNFIVHIPYRHIHVIYMRLLKQLNLTSQSYLGENMQSIYRNDLRIIEQHSEEIRREKEERERQLHLEEQEGRDVEEEGEDNKYGHGESKNAEMFTTPVTTHVEAHNSTTTQINADNKSIDRKSSTLFGLFEKRTSKSVTISESKYEAAATSEPLPADDAGMKTGLLGGVRHSLFGGPIFRRRSTHMSLLASSEAMKDSPTASRATSPTKSKSHSSPNEEKEVQLGDVQRMDANSGEGETTFTPLLVNGGDLERTDTLVDDPDVLSSLL